MNYEITLELNGYKRNILRYNYCFSRKVDSKGRPTTGVQDGSIYVEMESDGDSSIFDMMLADMNKPRCFFPRIEPIPVSGKIRHTKDDMMIRELVFDEAYICSYGERMNAIGTSPMITRFLISSTRLDINRTIRLDRRIKTTYGFWWEEYNEENIIFSSIQNVENIETEVSDIDIVTPLLINKHTNKKGFEYDQTYKLKVKSYTSGAPKSKHAIKWEYNYISNKGDVVVGAFEEGRNQGEVIDFKVINEDMIGTTLTFYAYISDKSAGGKCSIYVNPLYYYKGKKQWGKLQSERDDEKSLFTSCGHKLSLKELLNNKNADFWARSRMIDLNKLTEDAVLNRYKFINVFALSDDDNIEQVVTNNFVTGKKSLLSFDEHSILSKKLHSVPSFQAYFQAYLDIIKDLIKENKLEGIDGKEMIQKFAGKGYRSGTPNFSVIGEMLSYDYYGIFGGTQKIILEIEVVQYSLHKYQIKTKMYIKDWYGADWDDINGVNAKALLLPCFFWLQHHYGYQPFETEVIFTSTDIITI